MRSRITTMDLPSESYSFGWGSFFTFGAIQGLDACWSTLTQTYEESLYLRIESEFRIITDGFDATRSSDGLVIPLRKKVAGGEFGAKGIVAMR